MAIDIQTVRTTLNKQIENTLMNKRNDNNYISSTKNYSDIVILLNKLENQYCI